MSTTSIHVTLPKAMKEHVDKRVAEGEFLSPEDYIRALDRADRNDRLRREELLWEIGAGLADADAGRVYDGDLDLLKARNTGGG